MGEMTEVQRAKQLWSLLAFAAREQKRLSYKEISRLTGMAKPGLGAQLKYLYDYCEKHNLPQLNLLAINEETGRPGENCPENPRDLSEQQARVFVYDWLERGAPTIEDLETTHKIASP